MSQEAGILPHSEFTIRITNGEAPSGFEPLVELLQSSALPLGHGAVCPTYCNTCVRGRQVCQAALRLDPYAHNRWLSLPISDSELLC